MLLIITSNGDAIDQYYLRTETAKGSRASHEHSSDFLFF